MHTEVAGGSRFCRIKLSQSGYALQQAEEAKESVK